MPLAAARHPPNSAPRYSVPTPSLVLDLVPEQPDTASLLPPANPNPKYECLLLTSTRLSLMAVHASRHTGRDTHGSPAPRWMDGWSSVFHFLLLLLLLLLLPLLRLRGPSCSTGMEPRTGKFGPCRGDLRWNVGQVPPELGSPRPVSDWPLFQHAHVSN